MAPRSTRNATARSGPRCIAWRSSRLAAIGLPMQAVRGRAPRMNTFRRYVDLFDTIPRALDMVRVTGKDCFVVRWLFTVPADLERVVAHWPRTAA